MNLIEQLKQIPDRRGTRGKRYPLWQLWLLALLGSLCGYIGYRPLAAFCRENWRELEAVLALPSAVPTPSYSTFRRLFMAVEYTRIAHLFDTWCHHFMRPTPGMWLGGDGKSIRCTSSNNGGHYLSSVSLYSHTPGCVVALKLMENDQRSEISVIRECIQSYDDIPGLTYTLDALHCQRDTVDLIVAQHQYYLITVKGNQKTLLESLTHWVSIHPPLSVAQHTDPTHGRTVTRTVSVFAMPPELTSQWRASQPVIAVKREGLRAGKSFGYQTLYISNHQFSAAEYSPHIQERWGIENRLHWVRD
ncbi:MAG: ISAs1 family transposase [Cyanobacteria bacterium J06639_14]